MDHQNTHMLVENGHMVCISARPQFERSYARCMQAVRSQSPLASESCLEQMIDMKAKPMTVMTSIHKSFLGSSQNHLVAARRRRVEQHMCDHQLLVRILSF